MTSGRLFSVAARFPAACLLAAYAGASACTGASDLYDIVIEGGYPDLEEADGLFEAGEYGQALAAYEASLPLLDSGAARVAALTRSVSCLAHLGREAEGFQRLVDAPLPGEERLDARILLARARIAERLAGEHASLLDGEVLDPGAAPASVMRMTKGALVGTIEQDYETLWLMRETTVHMDVRREYYVVDLGSNDPVREPTIFDVAVGAWVDFLRNGKMTSGYENTEALWAFVESGLLGGKGERLRTLPVDAPCRTIYLPGDLDGAITGDERPDLRIYKAMHQAGSFHPEGREQAAEIWLVRSVSESLDGCSRPYRSQAKLFTARSLLRLYDGFETDVGRAEALESAGWHLEDAGRDDLAVPVFEAFMTFDDRDLPEPSDSDEHAVDEDDSSNPYQFVSWHLANLRKPELFFLSVGGGLYLGCKNVSGASMKISRMDTGQHADRCSEWQKTVAFEQIAPGDAIPEPNDPEPLDLIARCTPGPSGWYVYTPVPLSLPGPGRFLVVASGESNLDHEQLEAGLDLYLLDCSAPTSEAAPAPAHADSP